MTAWSERVASLRDQVQTLGLVRALEADWLSDEFVAAHFNDWSRTVNLSPNFTIEELTRSQAALRLGIPNVPNAAQLDNLRRLCHSLLEPARQFAAVAFHVDSGFRCEQVNAAVGSTAKHSAHLDGRAADIVPVGADLRITFDRIRQNPSLPYDQIILECNAWIHLAIAPAGSIPRHQALLASGNPGAWSYVPAP